MSEMKGRSVSPRPCILAESEPPMVSRSAPVCFWLKAHCCSRPACAWCSASSNPGHCMPASTSISPRSMSNASTLASLRVSTSTPSSAKACEPIEWRPPQMQSARFSVCASLSAARTPSSVSGWTMRLTLVAESWP